MIIYLSGCDLWVSSHLTLTKSPWQRKDVITSASQICCGVTCTKIWQIGAPEQCRSFIWTNSISNTTIYIYSSVNFLFKNYCPRKMSGCKSCKNILSGKIKLQLVYFSLFFFYNSLFSEFELHTASRATLEGLATKSLHTLFFRALMCKLFPALCWLRWELASWSVVRESPERLLGIQFWLCPRLS